MGREHALYAVDLEDAVNAAVEMARKRAAASCKLALWIFLFPGVQKLTTDGPANLGQLSCAQDAQRMSERTHTELRIARAVWRFSLPAAVGRQWDTPMKDYQTHLESGGSYADQRSGNRPAKTRTVREARSAFEHAGAEVGRAMAPVDQATSVMTSDTGPSKPTSTAVGSLAG
jgi:hypothetical protein